MRSRRVALLLTGVLPLLADDDIPITHATEAEAIFVDEQDQNVSRFQSAAQALHEDALTALPSLPLELLQYDNDPFALVDSRMLDHHPDGNMLDLKVIFDQILLNNTCNLTEHDFAETDTLPSRPADGPLNETDKAERQDSAGKEATDAAIGALDDDEEEDIPIERLVVDYASKSAGALVLESSPSMKGASNLLNGDKDQYSIAPCGDKKKVVIGLSEDILVKQVKLANYERYSSQVEKFQILGSQTMGDWADLGTYTAESRLGEQTFDLKEPSWVRYLTFRFLSHFGSEHYCTISQIKVHGSTMLQGFHEQWKESEEETQQLLKEVDEENENVLDPTSTEVAGTSEEHAHATTPSAGETPAETASVSSERVEVTDDSAVGSADAVNDHDAEVDSAEDSASDVETGKAGDPSAALKVPAPVMDDSGTPPVDATETSGDEAKTVTEETSKPQAMVDESAGIYDYDSSKASPEPHEGLNTLPASEMDSSLPKDAVLQPDDALHPALRSASIEITSQKSSDALVKGGTKELGTDAIMKAGSMTNVASATKNVVAEASDAINTVQAAPTVSDAILELQQKLKTSKGAAQNVDRDELTTAKIPDTGREPIDSKHIEQPVGQYGNDGGGILEDSSTAAQSTRQGKADDVSNEAPAGDKTASGKSIDESPRLADYADEEEVQGVKTETPDAERKVEIKTGIDEAELDPVLSELLEKLPSAACMKELNFQDVKARIIAARKGGPSSGGASANGGAAGRMEPIFKTLTDELKSLQINNSAQKHYTKALVSCYQKVMLDMMKEVDIAQKQNDARLSELERAMQDMASRSWLLVLQEVGMGFVFLFSFLTALIFRWAGVVLPGIILKAPSCSSSHVPLLGFGFVVMLAFLTFHALRRRRKAATLQPSEQKTLRPEPSPAPQTALSPVESVESLCPYNWPQKFMSESDPALQTPPSSSLRKCASVETKPTIIPAE